MSSHLSEDQLAAWIAGERSGEAAEHLRECAACAAEAQRTADALRLFRDSGFQCAEYWSQQPAPQKAPRCGEWAMASVVLAIVLIGAAVLRHPPPRPAPAQRVFMQIPYVAPPAPYERTEVVRMDVPVAALIAVGFRLDTAAAADSVPADVLVGQDGRPLAVSFPESNHD